MVLQADDVLSVTADHDAQILTASVVLLCCCLLRPLMMHRRFFYGCWLVSLRPRSRFDDGNMEAP